MVVMPAAPDGVVGDTEPFRKPAALLSEAANLPFSRNPLVIDANSCEPAGTVVGVAA